MEITQWLIGDIKMLEPMTALTDFLITAVCLWGFCKLLNLSKQNGNYLKIYPYFILLMGLGTFFAALLTHSFAYMFNDEMLSNPEILFKTKVSDMSWQEKFQINIHNFPNWLLNVVSVTLFELSIIKRAKYYLENLNVKLFYWIIGIETTTIIVIMMIVLKYDLAIAHIGFALFVISLPLQIKIYREYKANDAKYLIIGTLIMLIIAPVMVTKFEFGQWFNFNDISHVTIATTMFLFSIAGTFMYEKNPIKITQKS